MRIISKIFKTCCPQEVKYFLAIVSFIESSFFPIPPDVMIVPMVIAKKNDYIKIIDVISGGPAWRDLIGSSFFDVGMKVVEFYDYEENDDIPLIGFAGNWVLYLVSHFISCRFYTITL